MPTANPTLPDQRWGPEAWCLFDHWRNPTRLEVSAERPYGANPLLFLRHGGGGTGGDYRHYRTSDYGDWFYFVQWLLGAHVDAPPTLPWDVCAFTSGQAQWSTFFGEPLLVERCLATYFPDQDRDCQRAIANIRHLSRSLGFDPDRCAGMGNSFGAVVMARAQLAPPTLGSGGLETWTERVGDPRTHGSRLAGVLLADAQVDCRKSGGVYYHTPLSLAGWFGTSVHEPPATLDVDALPPALLAAASLRRYFEVGDTQFYPGFFVTGAEQGDHVKPYTNPHDSDQVADLAAAMDDAGVGYASLLTQPGDLTNANWPAAPSAATLAIYRQFESWLAARV